ncbi:MAG: DUF4956 domain-containing protein [Ignavibacteriaceae bacterium]|jgi:uncharacterized membrane protein YhiD involved in acid resistance
MFQDFQNIFTFSLSPGQVLINLVIALLCGFIISLFYKWTYRGPNYSSSYVNSIIVLAMITAVVIMVIGNNLARAFGLVGAMSIIRFRTAVKDTQDIVFIFFALAVGLAAGVGLHIIAIAGTLFISLIVWILYLTNYGNPQKKDFLLQFSLKAEDNENALHLPILAEYCRSFKLINMKSFEAGRLLELTYYVNLKRKENSDQFVRALDNLQDVNQVNLFFDEEQF